MPPKAKLKHEDSGVQDTPWKSRFPVARIKKIMQADEDVGKVAQVVPVIISKALELFMDSMIQEASRHTIETGHKRIIPGHLKMAVKGNQMFDFLEGNVEAIPNPVHVEARQAEDKRTRKPRTKKEPIHDDPEPVCDLQPEVYDEGEDDEEDHQRKKVKLPSPASDIPGAPRRSMSIAALMSPPSPPSTQTESQDTNDKSSTTEHVSGAVTIEAEST